MRRDAEHGNSSHQQVICKIQQGSFCAVGGVEARLVLFQNVLEIASNHFPLNFGEKWQIGEGPVICNCLGGVKGVFLFVFKESEEIDL